MNRTPSPPSDIVTCVHQSDLESLSAALQEWGYRVFVLDGAEVRDQNSFLKEASATLPLEGGNRPRSWDGLSDQLWGGLYGIEEERVAIVWQDAQAMLQQNLQDFLIVVRVFTDVARSVGSGEHGFSHPMALCLFLVGQGAMFPRLSPE